MSLLLFAAFRLPVVGSVKLIATDNFGRGPYDLLLDDKDRSSTEERTEAMFAELTMRESLHGPVRR
jgi:hypothetical protein